MFPYRLILHAKQNTNKLNQCTLFRRYSSKNNVWAGAVFRDIRRVSSPGNRDWIPSDPLPAARSVAPGSWEWPVARKTSVIMKG